ncbi:YtxH domain-containing protein [uncultured Clostridium sp.]|jgi:gas vesicle protein|uniref:YtxH domain-containing protein n=1 Tax=uncultured Clostridium sp. TaxID=59620 RepID=UPI00260B7CB6|nr:YtxH domain-containing protein [uncultured Clostridium sp.]
MRLSQLLEEKRKAKKRQAMAKTAKTVGITAIVGASVGALGGILFAPKSGKETREDLKNTAIDTNEKFKVKATDAKVKLNEKIQDGKGNLSEANLKIKDYLKSKKNKLEVVESNEEVAELSETATTEEEVQA